jgi:phage-related protein
MKWRITFYSQKVKSQALAFPNGILANFLHIIGLVEEFGPHIGMPYTRPMGSGLFEVRARGKEGIGRALFCTLPGRELMVLNTFIKKSKKTPQKKLELARKRMRKVSK